MQQARTNHVLVAIKSGAVGIAATLADLLVLTVLVELAGVSPAIANVPALAAGVAAQFAGNKLFAFKDSARGAADVARQGALFLVVEAFAFALNAFLFDRLVALTPVPYLIARLGVQLVVYFGFSLPLWSRIFSTRS